MPSTSILYQPSLFSPSPLLVPHSLPSYLSTFLPSYFLFSLHPIHPSTHPHYPIPADYPVSHSPSDIYLNILLYVSMYCGKILALTWPRSSTFGLLTRFVSFHLALSIVSLLSSPYTPSSPSIFCLDLMTLRSFGSPPFHAFYPLQWPLSKPIVFILLAIPIDIHTMLTQPTSLHRSSVFMYHTTMSRWVVALRWDKGSMALPCQ